MVAPSDLDPHCPEQRYRLYRRRGDELVCVSACADAAHVVAMIADQRNPEGGDTLADDDAVGLLDAHGFREHNPLNQHGNYTLPGSWLIKPWVPRQGDLIPSD
jgi:hypothetical protein